MRKSTRDGLSLEKRSVEFLGTLLNVQIRRHGDTAVRVLDEEGRELFRAGRKTAREHLVKLYHQRQGQRKPFVKVVDGKDVIEVPVPFKFLEDLRARTYDMPRNPAEGLSLLGALLADERLDRPTVLAVLELMMDRMNVKSDLWLE